jgi:sulfur carrier protein
MSDTSVPTLTILLNGEPHPTTARTLDALVTELLAGPARHGIAVAVNDAVVRRSAWADHPLTAGSRVELIRAVGGG